MIKIYQALNENRLVTLVKDSKGDYVTIEFRGGDSNQRGTLLVKNKELQDAIEKSPAYGKRYRLLKTIKNDDADISVQAVIKDEEERLNKQEEIVIKKKLVFRTLNEAQSVLTEDPYNIPKSHIRTSAQVVEKAKEKGVEVEFEK